MSIPNTDKTSTPPHREITIQGKTIPPGGKEIVELPIGSMIDYQPVTMTVHVRRGKEAGPCLLITAGIHGDEINGVEIVRRLLKSSLLKGLKGDLIAVPVVNVPSFLNRMRYLPDRRDLNRLFPGSQQGSLGGRLASIFVSDLIPHCTHAIDLHTGTVGRPNLPQIRISPNDSVALDMARAFHPPVVLSTSLREGSLRATYYEHKKPSLLYEAGEAHRLDLASVRYGLRGVISTMRHLGMLPEDKKAKPPKSKTLFSPGTNWIRAPRGGIFAPSAKLGRAVAEGSVVGHVCDPLGQKVTRIKSNLDGIIIGISCEATVDEGDALFHVASSKNPERAEEQIEHHEQVMEDSVDLFAGEE